MPEPLQIVSFGGGVQSHGLLALAAMGKVPYRTFVFANVGDDSESSKTIAYMAKYTFPFCEEWGLDLHVARHWADNPTTHSRKTLYRRIMDAGPQGGQFVGIPMRIGEKGIASRNCTMDYKIRAIVQWCRDHGATLDNPAITALGISTDEFHRAKRVETEYQKLIYPLLEMRYSRTDCRRFIEQVGLPQPPKSSCFFCPYHSKFTWAKMRRDDPEEFALVCEMERVMTARRADRGYGPVYFHDRRKPLAEAVRGDDLDAEDEENTCESGFCMV